jgi:hypothetical protein
MKFLWCSEQIIDLKMGWGGESKNFNCRTISLSSGESYSYSKRGTSLDPFYRWEWLHREAM